MGGGESGESASGELETAGGPAASTLFGWDECEELLPRMAVVVRLPRPGLEVGGALAEGGCTRS